MDLDHHGYYRDASFDSLCGYDVFLFAGILLDVKRSYRLIAMQEWLCKNFIQTIAKCSNSVYNFLGVIL